MEDVEKTSYKFNQFIEVKKEKNEYRKKYSFRFDFFYYFVLTYAVVRSEGNCSDFNQTEDHEPKIWRKNEKSWTCVRRISE